MTDKEAIECERFVPGMDGGIWMEHWHRYHFCLPLAGGKVALDVATGEGYGANFLASRAKSVVGVDVENAVLKSASIKYGSTANLRFLQADCRKLPFADRSFDLVVSFETLEHVHSQELLVSEAARVLRDDGLFVVSSPNRPEYSGRQGTKNAFHVGELDATELGHLLGRNFPCVKWFGQSSDFYSVLAPFNQPANVGQMIEVDKLTPESPAPSIASPTYFICVCAKQVSAAAHFDQVVSVLADRSHWVGTDYRNTFASMSELARRTAALESAVQGMNQDLLRLADERDRLLFQVSLLTSRQEAEQGK